MTELRWDGKYDSSGKKVAPPRICLPFQTVETVNESALERERTLDLFSTGRETEWRNRLIWGDKKYVLPSLLPEFAGKVNLIYIDPPFNTGADFSFTTTIPDSDETFVKEPSVIEQKAYRDTWGKGMDSYLKWFYDTVVILRELLTDDGSIYVHLDWHIGHYAKAVMDEVFGEESFQNEIAWCYREAINSTKRWNRKHDNILFFTKNTDKYLFNADLVLQPHSAVTIAKYKYSDENGRYRLMGRGIVGSPIQSARDIAPEWEKTHPDLVYRHYLRDGTYGLDYWNIDIINQAAHERLKYPTQKPEALLERIIKASSNEGDLILDCFCGSGTTAAVAEKLGRRWITCDLGRFAIHTARKRLLGIEGVRPFSVLNLGKYERQAWQKAEFGEHAQAQTLAYRNFILEIYKARPLQGHVWLHGVKNGRMVHVGEVDSPISVGDVQNIAIEFRRVMGTGQDAPTSNGVDVLGWDFAFEINEVAKQQATLANIDMRFVRIPREVLEKKAVEAGDIRFFELAALAVDIKTLGKSVTLALTDFVIPVDDVPADIQAAIKHWAQWIDYWAVDWNNKSDTFHNEWQSYRTRKNSDFQKQIAHTYDAPGEYTVVVKVIDILGNDTTKTLKVTVA